MGRSWLSWSLEIMHFVLSYGLDFIRIFHTILKQFQATVSIYSTRPLRMLVRMNVIFGVRHQAKDISLWVANPGNIKD